MLLKILKYPQLPYDHDGPYDIQDSRGGSRGGGTIGKTIIFWRKIVIFHTKYPKNFRASLRSAHFF